jgi:hypothetical protein
MPGCGESWLRSLSLLGAYACDTEMEAGKGMSDERRLAMCFTERKRSSWRVSGRGRFDGQILPRDSCRWMRAWRADLFLLARVQWALGNCFQAF